ncbi:MAG: putative glycolipid-binding domain-containing protein, partial [Treponema sp.]|nr:putative glycolipid-binding domain-containing protein [Treponema sp.]
MNQTINVNNLIEIRRIGLQALKEALGPVGMVRFIRKVWFNTPELAPAQTRQRFQKFGIKPDGIINFLFERASVPN